VIDEAAPRSGGKVRPVSVKNLLLVVDQLNATVVLLGLAFGASLIGGCSGISGDSGHVSEPQVSVNGELGSSGSVLRSRLKHSLPSFATGEAGSTSSSTLAPLFGNLTVAQATAGNGVVLERGSDCSLTFTDLNFTANTTSTTYQINKQTRNYERLLHANAFLKTTPNVFASGCADSLQGQTSNNFIDLGNNAAGQDIGAQISPAGVYTAVLNTDGTLTMPALQATEVDSQGLVGADLNKDGDPDLISVNSNALKGDVTVFLGKAGGTFQAGVTYPLPGQNAFYAVVDDLNNDGNLDLLVSSDTPSFSFSIFLGKGDGTFSAPVQFSPSGLIYSDSFMTVDVNGDGFKDIITSAGLIFLGKGDGLTFTQTAQPAFAKLSQATNFYAPRVVAADFNNDGKIDLATDDGRSIRVNLGKGDGTFIPGAAYGTLPNRGYLSATDVDGDGNIDLVSGLHGPRKFSGDDYEENMVYVLMGNGDGTFQGAANLTATFTGNNLVDLNGDGHPDLVGTASVMVSGVTSQVFTTLLGQANGLFTSGPQLSAPNGIESFAIADFNGDHIPDLIYNAGNVSSTAGYYLALGKGDGSFQVPTLIAAPSFLPPGDVDVNPQIAGMMTGDFNHDGKADLIYSFTDNSFNTQNITQGFVVQLGKGDSTFGPAVITTTYSSTTHPQVAFGVLLAAVADLNGDNFPEVFAVIPGAITAGTLQHQLQMFAGKGDGSFAAPVNLSFTGNILPATYQLPLAFADLNGDGKLDIVASGSSPDGTTPEIAIVLGNGNLTFQTPTVLKLSTFGYAQGVALGDFTGDGKLDLFAQGIYPGNGDGTFQTLANTDGTVDAPQPVLLYVFGAGTSADFDGDGHADVLVGNTVLLNRVGQVTPPPNLDESKTSLTASASSVGKGQSVTFTATVTSAASATIPTGTVTFLDGGTSIGTGTLNGSAVATFAISALAGGTHSITASYGGDATFASSTSTAVTVTVGAGSSGDFSLSATPASASVTAGSSATSTITVTPSGGFSTQTSFACSGLPQFASCSFSPATVTPSGSPASTTVTVTTSAATAMMLPTGKPQGPTLPWLVVALLCLVIVLSTFISRLAIDGPNPTLRRLALTCICVIAIASLGFAGCGGSSGSTTAGGNTGTPAGTSTVTITATAGSTTHTTTLTLTVH
jgi:hypothetical protein